VQLITQKSRGELVAIQLCAQCHGTDFHGKTVGVTVCPALDAVADLSFAHFDEVVTAETEREGAAMVAVDNAYERLPLEDRRALYDYLASLLQKP
jgi:mono/diheme cytochrome c family protein